MSKWTLFECYFTDFGQVIAGWDSGALTFKFRWKCSRNLTITSLTSTAWKCYFSDVFFLNDIFENYGLCSTLTSWFRGRFGFRHSNVSKATLYRSNRRKLFLKIAVLCYFDSFDRRTYAMDVTALLKIRSNGDKRVDHLKSGLKNS